MTLGAATLGVTLQDSRAAVAVVVIAIAFLAGLPKPVFPYLALVGKMAAAVVIITAMGFAATADAAVAFVGGGLFALAATVIEARWRNAADPGTSPFDEWRAVWSGDTNPWFYAVTLAATVGLGMLLAVALDAKLPGWVGLWRCSRLGRDAPLLKWRLYDTLLGCAAVAVALVTVRGARRWRSRWLR